MLLEVTCGGRKWRRQSDACVAEEGVPLVVVKRGGGGGKVLLLPLRNAQCNINTSTVHVIVLSTTPA
jgi:hypothetical protein